MFVTDFLAISSNEISGSLRELLESGTVEEVYGIAIGDREESWVCAYRDTSERNRIG